MYSSTSETAVWNGKAIKGADPASFESLTDTLARDRSHIYMLGKVAKVDAASFEVLSPCYARDCTAVYLIMQTKLKVIKGADTASFVALADTHGRDANSAFCRDKRMRLSKGRAPNDLIPLGHIYASDGVKLFFGTQGFSPPESADLNAGALRLRWFDDCEVNLPIVTIADGQGCWMRGLAGQRERWIALEGADFETLAPIETSPDSYWGANYARDARQVWFLERPVQAAQPAQCAVFGRDMLRDGAQLWHGDTPLAISASDVTAIPGRYVPDQGYSTGTLLHSGEEITLYTLGQEPEVLARAPQELQDWREGLRAVLHTLFHMFEHYLPHQWTPQEALRDIGAEPVQSALLPECRFELTGAGEICAHLADGTDCKRPAAAWFSLACDLWAHVQGRAPSLLCYPALGIMYPRSTDLFEALVKRHRAELRLLCAHVARAGHGAEAEVLAYQCLNLLEGSAPDLDQEELAELVIIPRALMPALGGVRRDVHRISATTHLAFARALVREKWLEADDPAIRIEAISRLHGAILETGKTEIFLQDIIPVLLERYASEAMQSVREHLAMALDAALIRGQVDCEVAQRCHHSAMLAIIRFCIAEGINVIYNRARLIEALYATGNDAEADVELEKLVEKIGENAPLQGVYGHRLVYRTPRLWVLRGRIDAAWSPATPSEHQARLAKLQQELDALGKRYGTGAQAWDEMKDIRRDLARYARALEPN